MDLALIDRDDAFFERPAGAAALEGVARLTSAKETITVELLSAVLREMEDTIASSEELISSIFDAGRELEEIFGHAITDASFESLRELRPGLIDYIDKVRLRKEQHLPSAHALEKAYRLLASRDAFTTDAWSAFHQQFLRMQDSDRRIKATLDAHLHFAETQILAAFDARLRELKPAELALDEAVDDIARRYSTVMEYLAR